jgi:hypothetical protein
LVEVELSKRVKELGFEVKAEVKSSGVVMQVVAISSIAAGSEAEAVGIKLGDRLYQINGQMQDRWLHSKVRTRAKNHDNRTIEPWQLCDQSGSAGPLLWRLSLPHLCGRGGVASFTQSSQGE